MEDCSASVRNQSISVLLAPAVANQYTYSNASLFPVVVSPCSPSDQQTLLLDIYCLIDQYERVAYQFGSRYRCRSLRYDMFHDEFLSVLT